MRFRLESVEARINNLEARDGDGSRISAPFSRGTMPLEVAREFYGIRTALDDQVYPTSTGARNSQGNVGRLNNKRAGLLSAAARCSYRSDDSQENGATDGSSDNGTCYASTLRPQDSVSVRLDTHKYEQPHHDRKPLVSQHHDHGTGHSQHLRSQYADPTRSNKYGSTMSLQMYSRGGGDRRSQHGDHPRTSDPHKHRASASSRSVRRDLDPTIRQESSRGAHIAPTLDSSNRYTESTNSFANATSSRYTSPSNALRTRSSSAARRGGFPCEPRTQTFAGQRGMLLARVWQKTTSS